MKKFIAAFDGLNFSESTLSYAIYLAKHCNAHLVGVFLEDFMRRSYGVLELSHYEGQDLDTHMHELDAKDDETRKESVRQFQNACKVAEIEFSVHRDRDIAIHELLLESVYADLLIVSNGETLTRYQEPQPSRFIKELLAEVQCPVVLAPARYHPLNKIILLYDGEPSSVHAVRSFSYLFHDMKHLPTEVITVNSDADTMTLPNGRLIKEFIKQHYPAAKPVILTGVADAEIASYLKREKTYPIVVSGAYRRSKFSRLFRPSMADYLMQHVDVPLFIAHNKS